MMDYLKQEEKAVFSLRALYQQFGYSRFKMSKFEAYDLYAKNKEFLVSDGVITFTDTDGTLLALKPDVTLSMVKNYSSDCEHMQKLYYNENVYRIGGADHSYHEIMQTGLECLGRIDTDQLCEVVLLACKSLNLISNRFVLDLSDLDLITNLIEGLPCSYDCKQNIYRSVSEKNADALQALSRQLPETDAEKLMILMEASGDAEETLSTLHGLGMQSPRLEAIVDAMRKENLLSHINLDFSIISNRNYYNGIVFRGYVEGISNQILSGGQYDRLMEKMEKAAGGVGFAVYLDQLERYEPDKISQDTVVNVALPKGRLGEKVYQMFAAAGFPCEGIEENSRKLIFENKEGTIRFFWVKPSDVSIYVEHGAADLGVAGKDILLEYEPDLYELLDLNMGKCRMAVAAKSSFVDDREKTLRVATKFTNIAKKYYSAQCRDIELIKLNGSIELAPILGLSDVIVDIVETGATLKENDLVPFETIVPISARVVCNKASLKLKNKQLMAIVAALKGQVKQHD